MIFPSFIANNWPKDGHILRMGIDDTHRHDNLQDPATWHAVIYRPTGYCY